MIMKDLSELKNDARNSRLPQNYTIYSLVNLENKKRYIGRSKFPKNRIKQHLTELRGHYHSNKLLNEDSNCEFGFEILEENISFEERTEKERYYMKLYRTYEEEYGYNATDPGVPTILEEINSPPEIKEHITEIMIINVEKIRRLRKERGWTQAELAERIGAAHKATICKLEKKSRNCTLDLLNRLANAFECSPLSLVQIKEIVVRD